MQAARRESADLRTQLADGTRTARVEQVSALGQVEGIELNRYLTGGLDRDGIPGDELLSVLIVPTDSQGNLVKAPGSVSLAVFDLSKPESQQRIGRWEFTPQKSDSLWVSGFLGSGYVIRVPWQELPQSANLLVHARLKTIDGRQFDTSQSIHIVPPDRSGGACRASPPRARKTARRRCRPHPRRLPRPSSRHCRRRRRCRRHRSLSRLPRKMLLPRPRGGMRRSRQRRPVAIHRLSKCRPRKPSDAAMPRQTR